jgi:hypothetical protein
MKSEQGVRKEWRVKSGRCTVAFGKMFMGDVIHAETAKLPAPGTWVLILRDGTGA